MIADAFSLAEWVWSFFPHSGVFISNTKISYLFFLGMILATLTVIVVILIVSIETQSKTFQALKLFFALLLCPPWPPCDPALAVIRKNAVSIS